MNANDIWKKKRERENIEIFGGTFLRQDKAVWLVRQFKRKVSAT